ncbi:MAG TPA: prepilin-type N-terminal cleavage/methylation domain-containing protein [Gallionella sp.]|nr:prepilin-type N-terminal cleavage/methylation domain-containing protein [Gallionella sp.]
MSARKQQGLTLIEVLVSLLVFSLGLLGVALYTASGIKTASANQARATSVYAASLAMEPVLYQTRSDCLSAALGTFPRTVTSDNGKDSYTINLVRASDGRGNQIAANNAISVAASAWVSPVTITLGIPYPGSDNKVYTAYPSYTVVLENYTAACNA